MSKKSKLVNRIMLIALLTLSFQGCLSFFSYNVVQATTPTTMLDIPSSSSGWVQEEIQIVTNGSDYDNYAPTLFADRNGIPHIAYYTEQHHSPYWEFINYAHHNPQNGNWTGFINPVQG